MCELLELLPAEWLQTLFSLSRRSCRVEFVAVKRLLGVPMPQDHLVFLHILDLSVFRNAFLVVYVVFFDSLNRAIFT
jgi:hypothetical protein